MASKSGKSCWSEDPSSIRQDKGVEELHKIRIENKIQTIIGDPKKSSWMFEKYIRQFNTGLLTKSKQLQRHGYKPNSGLMLDAYILGTPSRFTVKHSFVSGLLPCFRRDRP